MLAQIVLLVFLIALSKELCQNPWESPNKLYEAFLLQPLLG